MMAYIESGTITATLIINLATILWSDSRPGRFTPGYAPQAVCTFLRLYASKRRSECNGLAPHTLNSKIPVFPNPPLERISVFKLIPCFLRYRASLHTTFVLFTLIYILPLFSSTAFHTLPLPLILILPFSFPASTSSSYLLLFLATNMNENSRGKSTDVVVLCRCVRSFNSRMQDRFVIWVPMVYSFKTRPPSRCSSVEWFFFFLFGLNILFFSCCNPIPLIWWRGWILQQFQQQRLPDVVLELCLF